MKAAKRISRAEVILLFGLFLAGCAGTHGMQTSGTEQPSVNPLIWGRAGPPPAPTEAELEHEEIRRLIANASDDDLRSCKELAGIVEGRPVGEYVGAGVGKVIGFVVLFPLAVLTWGHGLDRVFDGPGFSDALAARSANAEMREKLVGRCVDSVETERRVGGDDARMVGPLTRLAEVYATAERDPKALHQAAELYERALAIQEKNAVQDDESAKKIRASYATVLERQQRLHEALAERARLDRLRAPKCDATSSGCN